jgi:hypothetical protein
MFEVKADIRNLLGYSLITLLPTWHFSGTLDAKSILLYEAGDFPDKVK